MQNIPPDQKLVLKKEETPKSVKEKTPQKGRKRKNKQQVIPDVIKTL